MNSAQWQHKWPPYRSSHNHELWLPWPPYYSPFFKLLLHLSCKLLVDSVRPHIFYRGDLKNEFVNEILSIISNFCDLCYSTSHTCILFLLAVHCQILSLSLSLKFPPIRIRVRVEKIFFFVLRNVRVEKMTVMFRRFFFRFIYLFLKNQH